MPKNEVTRKPAYYYSISEGRLRRKPEAGETPDGEYKGYPYKNTAGVRGRITGVGLQEKQTTVGPLFFVSLKVETPEEVSFIQCGFSGGGFAKSLAQRLVTISATNGFDQEYELSVYQMERTVKEGESFGSFKVGDPVIIKGFSIKDKNGNKVENTKLELRPGKTVMVNKKPVWDDSDSREDLTEIYEKLKIDLLNVHVAKPQDHHVEDDDFDVAENPGVVPPDDLPF